MAAIGHTDHRKAGRQITQKRSCIPHIRGATSEVINPLPRPLACRGKGTP